MWHPLPFFTFRGPTAATGSTGKKLITYRFKIVVFVYLGGKWSAADSSLKCARMHQITYLISNTFTWDYIQKQQGSERLWWKEGG